MYRLPILMIALFAVTVFLQLLSFIFSMHPELKIRTGERIAAIFALLILVIVGGILFLRPAQELASRKGGGLLQPNLFKFDFSQVLKLESEISMNDDLVFIVKKEDRDDDHILLRRYVLSGYGKSQGFFREETIDEKTQPGSLPNQRTEWEGELVASSYTIDQEYYIVNFDGSAFIGMNQPISVTPYETWDASSFNSAYKVQSRVSDISSETSGQELYGLVHGTITPEKVDLSDSEYQFYTEYGNDERLKRFALELTAGKDGYLEKIGAIYETLKFGEYTYSLKPGIAPDGDQLGYFLFESKKGYCSYYAFAFALLLRSLGIPTRVAAGFFIDPETETFDYYPVRSDMAHAWVEVRFPGYGWIEFDPTSETLAAGEEFRFSNGVDPDLFNKLMKEILENYALLRPKQGAAEEDQRNNSANFVSKTLRLVQKYWAFPLVSILLAIFLFVRTRYLIAAQIARKPRKKAVYLWCHTCKRLHFAGFKRGAMVSTDVDADVSAAFESEWAKEINTQIQGVEALYYNVASARFAQSYTKEHYFTMEEQYKTFSLNYKTAVPLFRRVMSWIGPPLTLIIPRALKIALLFIMLSFAGDIRAQDTGSSLGEGMQTSDSLYQNAEKAAQAENWERAVELYTRGEKTFPNDFRFPFTLGDLYQGRGLYSLAFEEYRKANILLPDNQTLLYKLSQATGYLNKDAESAAYLERLLALDPSNETAIANLGWMYFKLHRSEEGAILMEDAINRLGSDISFEMTLATIYSDLFRYDDSKKQYLSAILGAKMHGDDYFESIAHYNLSILESRFYNYGDAFKETEASLDAVDRASGHIARGEILLRRLDIKRGIDDYETAYETDDSPLAKVNLADSYQMAGRLNEARLYAEQCLAADDNSWMLNYGIDPIQYRRDIHEILYKTYKGLAKAEGFIMYGSVWGSVKSVFRALSYQFKGEVHKYLFKKYSLLSANAYITNSEPHIDALYLYYKAFESYPSRALSYIRRAREREVPIIPKAEPSYFYEEGSILKNKALLSDAIDGSDPIWERDMAAEIYTILAKMRGMSANDRKDAVERLFALNRGALRQNGIRLPVTLAVVGVGDRTEKQVQNAVKKAGLLSVNDSRFDLTITGKSPVALECLLYDNVRGTAIFSRIISLSSLSQDGVSAFSRTLGDLAFTE
jgi:tetratricopeptide (TPR) repeat protein